MPLYLDASYAGLIADEVTALLIDDGGYTKEEIIPGLVQAIIDVAGEDDQLLDMAMNALADGGPNV